MDGCVITDLADPESAWFEWSTETLNSWIKIIRCNQSLFYAECSMGYERMKRWKPCRNTLGTLKTDTEKAVSQQSNFTMPSAREKANVLRISLSALMRCHQVGSVHLPAIAGSFRHLFSNRRLIMP